MKKILLSALILFSFYLNAQIKTPVQEENTFRMMSYNIRNAKGLDNKVDYKRIAGVIEAVNPEVIALQELDSVTNRSGKTDVLKELADIIRLHYTYAAAIDYDGGKYGLGILSKKRPLSSRSISLPGREEKRVLLI